MPRRSDSFSHSLRPRLPLIQERGKLGVLRGTDQRELSISFDGDQEGS